QCTPTTPCGRPVIDLTLEGHSKSAAYGVSADGSVVVGWSGTENYSSRHAFRWENGVMTDLGTLGGQISWAYGVNADGSVVVGWSMNKDGAIRAFRWADDV